MSPLHTGTLSLVTISSLAAIAATVVFIIYAIKWSEDEPKLTGSGSYNSAEVYENQTKAEFSYYAAVIVLLFVISGMHGFALMKELL